MGEPFSGEISVEEAIERLRNRLLDLSARNRLLNYRYPKGRCVQIADKPSIDLVFDRLYVDGKGAPFKYVPDSTPDDYEGKRPEARHCATRIGIETSFDFPPNSSGSSGHRLHGIQTLLYPAELERQLRKIAGEAKTAVEETGIQARIFHSVQLSLDRLRDIRHNLSFPCLKFISKSSS